MKALLFRLIIFTLFISMKTYADRAMYVDKFDGIIGKTNEENALLHYAQSNDITTLLLYDLHIIHDSLDITNTTSNAVLANFISKAKTDYGIEYIAATAENIHFFVNVIDTYNQSRVNPIEKFDIYNLEFEFWNDINVAPNNSLCIQYLIPNGLPCNNAGGFQYFCSVLDTMRALSNNSTHPIQVEAYLGSVTGNQDSIIGTKVDRVRLSAYAPNPNLAFDYSEDRLINFSESCPNLDVSILYSTETNFMKSWLQSNSISDAEDLFMNDWLSHSVNWSTTVNITGFTYFIYSEMINNPLNIPDHNLIPSINIFPNPTYDVVNIETENHLDYINIYTIDGQFVKITTLSQIDVSTFSKGLYIFEIHSESGIIRKKILKN